MSENTSSASKYKNVFCDIKVYNTMYGQYVFHRRVPLWHAEWIDIAPHLNVKVVKKYRIDRSYYRDRRNDKRTNNS